MREIDCHRAAEFLLLLWFIWGSGDAMKANHDASKFTRTKLDFGNGANSVDKVGVSRLGWLIWVPPGQLFMIEKLKLVGSYACGPIDRLTGSTGALPLIFCAQFRRPMFCCRIFDRIGCRESVADECFACDVLYWLYDVGLGIATELCILRHTVAWRKFNMQIRGTMTKSNHKGFFNFSSTAWNFSERLSMFYLPVIPSYNKQNLLLHCSTKFMILERDPERLSHAQ